MKLLAVLLLFASLGVAQVTYTPTAKAGATVTLTSATPIGWCLPVNTVGTLTVGGLAAPACPSLSGTSLTAVYTAPSSGIVAVHSVGGCPVTPSDSIFNTRIDALPTIDQTPVTSTFGTSGSVLAIDSSWDVNVGDNTMPTVTEKFHYSFLYNTSAGFTWQQLPAPNRTREHGSLIDAYGTNGDGTDHHSVYLNHQTCQWYEYYQDVVEPVPAGTETTTSGLQYNGYSYTLANGNDGGGSTDAASLPLEAITLSANELRNDTIHHALRFTTNVFWTKTGAGAWPSTGGVGGGCCFQQGTRFRLKSSFNIATYSTVAQRVLTALKNYGGFLADNSDHAALRITVGNDVLSDPTLHAAVLSLSNLSATNFEVLDESGLMASSTSSAVKPDNSLGIVPTNSAVIKGGSNYYPIALIPVTVGSQDDRVVLQAGETWTPPVWVNGVPSGGTSAVTWTIGACSAGAGNCGSFSGGVYTAPATVTAPARLTCNLIATSSQDGAASFSIATSILPAGTIRIDAGTGTIATATTGGIPASPYKPTGDANYWYTDDGVLTDDNGYGLLSDTFPTQDWTGGALDPTGAALTVDNQLYKEATNANGDLIYGPFIVANGNYRATIYSGTGNDQWGNKPCNASQGAWSTYGVAGGYGSFFADAQGQITNSFYDPGILVNYRCFAASTLDIPATVTDHRLYVAVRAWRDSKLTHGAKISALSIASDATAAHWCIDSTQKGQNTNSLCSDNTAPFTPVSPGSQLQLSVTNWYETFATDPVWTISPTGLGSVSASGVYTAPGVITMAAPVTVTATSASNPSVSASVIIWIAASNGTQHLISN